MPLMIGDSAAGVLVHRCVCLHFGFVGIKYRVSDVVRVAVPGELHPIMM